MPCAFAVIIAASAQAVSSRGFIACSGPSESPIETVSRADARELELGEALDEALATRSASAPSQARMITPNSSPPSRQTTSSGRTHARSVSASAQSSSSPTPWPWTSLTRLKSSMSSMSTATGLVRPARLLQRGQQALVEAAVVEEAGQRVGLRLVLEPRADLRVVERERGGVGEALRELELVVGEEAVLADPVDVEHALDPRARDQRDRDQRLGVDRRARDEAHARVEVRLVDVRGLAVPRRPAGDALVEADLRRHDLVGLLVAREAPAVRTPLRLVGLVDRERVVRDQVAERVGDPHEQRVEALLGEHLVEDVGEPPVRLDELRAPQARESPA